MCNIYYSLNDPFILKNNKTADTRRKKIKMKKPNITLSSSSSESLMFDIISPVSNEHNALQIVISDATVLFLSAFTSHKADIPVY